MKFITVERLDEYIKKRIIREKDRLDFLGYQGENLYWTWIGMVRDRLLTKKGHSQSEQSSSPAESAKRRKK